MAGMKGRLIAKTARFPAQVAASTSPAACVLRTLYKQKSPLAAVAERGLNCRSNISYWCSASPCSAMSSPSRSSSPETRSFVNSETIFSVISVPMTHQTTVTSTPMACTTS